MVQFLKLVNGLPVMSTVGGVAAPYDKSTYFASGLAANTPISLPSSGSYNDSNAADLMVIYNDLLMEGGRDFSVVGAGPVYTQVQFLYDLGNDSVVRFKQGLGNAAPYDHSIAYPSGLAANTTITMPSSGTFAEPDGADVLVVLNDRLVEVTRDFIILGSGPLYSQIQFIYALPNDAIVRFKQGI